MSLKLKETNIANKHNMLKNPNWQEQTSWLFTSMTEELNWGDYKQLHLSGQGGTWTRNLRISSPAN